MFGEKLRIVIINDEKSVLDTAKTVLENLGHQVAAFADGESAIAYCSNEVCDLFLIDIVMPGLDGFATIEKIKKLNPKAKIVLISGYYGEFHRDFVDVDLYIPKPLTFQNLKESIKTVMSEKRGIEDD